MKLKTMNNLLILTCMFSGLSQPASADLFKCNACRAGYKCDGINQYPCSAGTYSHAGSSTCTNCEPGKYQDQSGQGDCKSCGAGKYSSGRGNVSCSTCPAGYYCPGGTDKIKCSEGHYQNAVGQSSCKICPTGTSTSYDATSCDCSDGREDCDYEYKEQSCGTDQGCKDRCTNQSNLGGYMKDCIESCYTCKDVTRKKPGYKVIYMSYDWNQGKCVETSKSDCRRK